MPILLNQKEATWGIRYLLFQLVFLSSLVLWTLKLVLPQVTAVTLYVTCWGVNFLAVCGIFHDYLRRSLSFSRKHIKKVLLTALAGLGIYLVVSNGLSQILEKIFPAFFSVNDATLAPVVKQNFPVMFLGIVFLVPVTEELLYRGVVFGLAHRYRRWLGYTLSVVVFGLIHVSGSVGQYEPLHLLVCFVQYIPAGLVLAGAYEYSGSIFTPTLIHMAVNAIAIMSMR